VVVLVAAAEGTAVEEPAEGTAVEEPAEGTAVEVREVGAANRKVRAQDDGEAVRVNLKVNTMVWASQELGEDRTEEANPRARANARADAESEECANAEGSPERKS
jgi:hypothetical protein